MNVLICPDRGDLVSFATGRLDDELVDEIASHLEACDACRSTLEEISDSSDPLAVSLRQHGKLPFSQEPALQKALEFVQEIGREASRSPAAMPPGKLPAQLKAIRDYQILEKLGEGGMGAVYKARHNRLKKIVAIKVLPADRMEDPHAVARFEREMEAVGKLEHPNIVRAMDAGEADGTHFLVMEYVAGSDLSHLVRLHGRLPIADACELIRQAALGLQSAHEHSLVHRDIKPSNLILSTSGTLKILDLGLALLGGEAAGGRELTTTGQLMGTLDYMAPEQGSSSHKVDIRADIYSLGATLYKLLTGQAPFGGEKYSTPVQKMMALATETPAAVESLRPDVPPDLAAIVTRMLAHDPNSRYSTPAEVAQSLQPFAQENQLSQLLLDPPSRTQDTTAPCSSTTEKHLSNSMTGTQSRPALQDVQEPPLPAVKAPSPNRVAPAPKPLLAHLGETAYFRPALIATAAALLLIAAVVVYRIQTDQGTFVVKIEGNEAQAILEGEGLIVRDKNRPEHTWTIKAAETTPLPSGEYKLEGIQPLEMLVTQDGGAEMKTREFTLKRKGKVLVWVTLEPNVRVAGKDATTSGARNAPLPTKFTNSLCMEFALVPKGKSWLGGGGGKVGDKEVEFKDDFYLGVYEVTQEEWTLVTGSNPSQFKAVEGVAKEDQKRFPVEHVSWDDTQLFIQRLNATAKEAGWVYRLPTEAEWEYACRGGPMSHKLDSAFDFYFDKPAQELLPDQANWEHGKGLKRTCKVGSYKPNRLGLYDMHGNVWEWCEDIFNKGEHRMMRGGSWGDSLVFRCAARIRDPRDPSHRGNFLGLRVARVRVGTSDPDRRAAEWVLSIGGRLSIAENGQERVIAAAKDLPAGAIDMRAVNLTNNPNVSDGGLETLNSQTNITYVELNYTKVTDAGLQHLKGLTKVWSLGLAGAPVTDAGLQHLKGFTNLSALELSSTKVTDAGLVHLKGMTKLRYFRLANTAITDAGLVHLKGLTNVTDFLLSDTQVSDAGLEHLAGYSKLEHLGIKRAKVTEAGVKKLSAALPKCQIDWDGGVIGPTVAADPDRRAAEWVLSIGGGISIKENGQERQLGAAADLPKGPFELTVVNLRSNSKASDAGLALFKDCKNLTDLDLAGTQVSDAGLVHFKDCKNLMSLDLGFTKVGDAGLAHFKDCKNLTQLDLHNTLVSDAGLAVFKDCKNLTDLQLNDTPVSDAGLVHFADCKNLTYLRLNSTQVGDAGLAHFKDCKNVTKVVLHHTKVSDAGLAHFKDYKDLTYLDLHATQVGDAGLAHLKDCKNLTYLALAGTQVGDAGLERLAGCPKLGSLSVHNTKVTEAGVKKLSTALPLCKVEWDGGVKPLFFQMPGFDQWVKEVAAMSAEKQVEAVSKKLVELNPGFDGKEEHKVEDGAVTELRFKSDNVADISPVRALVRLSGLACASVILPSGKLADLSPLKGMQLAILACHGNRIHDLSPLAGMKLVELNCGDNPFADLSPLKGMPLRSLNVGGSDVSELSMLKEMPLNVLSFNATKVTDLSPLKGMALTRLFFQGNAVVDLSPLEGMPLETLNCGKTQAFDLSPLKGMPLTSLYCFDTPIADPSLLQEFKNLTTLNLSRTKVIASGVTALQKALPNCKIEWDDPANPP